MSRNSQIHPLCKRVRDIRGEVPLREFASKTGVHFNTLINYEAGRMPPLDFLYRVVEVTKCDPAWLFFGADPSHRGGVPVDDLPLLIEISELTAESVGKPPRSLPHDHADIVRAAYQALKASTLSLETNPQREVIASFIEAAKKLARQRGVRKSARRTVEVDPRVD